MAGLDDIYAQIPISDIARKLGADEGEVDNAVHTLVPVLLSGLQHNSQDPEHASKIEYAASGQAARGLLDAGGGSTRSTRTTGTRRLRRSSVARTPTKSRRRWPGAVPATAICSSSCYRWCCRLCWRTSENSSAAGGAAAGATASQQTRLRRRAGRNPGQHPRRRRNDKSLGGILGSVLGGKGGGLGDILGGLLGGKK